MSRPRVQLKLKVNGLGLNVGGGLWSGNRVGSICKTEQLPRQDRKKHARPTPCMAHLSRGRYFDLLPPLLFHSAQGRCGI